MLPFQIATPLSIFSYFIFQRAHLARRRCGGEPNKNCCLLMARCKNAKNEKRRERFFLRPSKFTSVGNFSGPRDDLEKHLFYRRRARTEFLHSLGRIPKKVPVSGTLKLSRFFQGEMGSARTLTPCTHAAAPGRSVMS